MSRPQHAHPSIRHAPGPSHVRLLVEHLVHERDGNGALADGRRHARDVPRTHVADVPVARSWKSVRFPPNEFVDTTACDQKRVSQTGHRSSIGRRVLIRPSI